MTENGPDAVGIPVIWFPTRFRPAGNAPAVIEYGACAEGNAVIVYGKLVPAFWDRLSVDGLVMPAMVRARLRLTDPPTVGVVADTVTLNNPAAVGVPEMTPPGRTPPTPLGRPVRVVRLLELNTELRSLDVTVYGIAIGTPLNAVAVKGEPG